MRDGPAILIDKAWAKLMGWSAQPLHECLTVVDPKCYFNKAYKDGRWDGKIHLFEGTRFPAGLTQRVIDHFATKDIRAVIRGWEPPETDVSEFTKDYFSCLGPACGIISVRPSARCSRTRAVSSSRRRRRARLP